MRFPDISKRPWRNVDMVIAGLCDIIDGLSAIVSLGFYSTQIAMSYLCWRSDKMYYRMKNDVG